MKVNSSQKQKTEQHKNTHSYWEDNKKKFMSIRANMCYSQILILIIASFAFSYLIYQSSATLNEIKNSDNDFDIFVKVKNNADIVKIIGLFIFQKLKQPILPMISAQDPLKEWACCEKNNNGAFCTYRPQEECNSAFRISPNECEDTIFCELGCCFSGETGQCSARTAKANCQGQWFENENCYIQECKRGCCILNTNAKWTSEKECEIKSGELGIAMDFRNEVSSEVACLYLTESDVEGACVLETGDIIKERNCLFTTLSECETRLGNFYANTFCSNPELNTTCASQDHTGCVEGKDEVYWSDSCNNREEIKEECSIFAGTRCGQYRPSLDEEPDTGDYVCRDLSCNVEINGQVVNKKNGESWCEYEGCIGEGNDPVGSRHMRHICYFGEEKTEACDDFRNQLCVQDDTELADGSVFSEASCRVNRWRSCYEYNNEQAGMSEKCAENPDCTIKGVHIDKFSFDVCVPNYPPGFEFWNAEDSSRSGELECSFATQKCPVVYVKRTSGWKCEMNCDCEKGIFTQQMNDLCISLGDCGGYINFNGDYTDDGYSSGAGRINGNQYEYCAEYQPNQKPAEPGDFGFSQILGIPEGVGEGEVPEANAMLGMLGAGMSGVSMMKIGSTGAAAAALQGAKISELVWVATDGTTYSGASALGEAWLAEDLLTGEVTGGNLYVSGEGGSLIESGYGESATKTGGFKLPPGWGDALAGIGAALAVAGFMQAAFGADAGLSYAIGGAFGTYVWLYNPGLWWVGAGLAIAQLIFGWGKTKIKYVAFTCMPWQAPRGGLNCDLCNTNNPLGVPCSEYRCKSLGQTCEFINPRTEYERCVSIDPGDISSPIIKPFYANITKGYEYINVNNDGFEIKSETGECIPEYTLLSFGIETVDDKGNPKPAQCRIGTDIMQDYGQMEAFGGKSSYITEHTMQLAIPSPSAFKNRYNLTDEEVKTLGDLRYYVNCESVNGNSRTIPFTIKTCVKPGPDLTAPRITKAIPEIGYVKYGETEKELLIHTNEPADCKYSNENKDYDSMENSITCLTDIENYGLYGWPCTTTLTGIDANSKFYIKCKDQPWLDEANNSRNAMTESYEYNLQVSKTPLIIEDFRPENNKEIISGVEPVLVELKIKTSGGADGTSTCKWEGNGYSDDFPENSNFHIYTITSATRGSYDIKFTCEDKAGNLAEAETSFRIKVDTTGPKITRMFYEGGLKINTNENAECRYSFSKRTNWDNSSIMSGFGLEHTANWQLKTYYVQCEDEFENKGGKTAIKPYALI